ncbi:hypothetical protein LUZ60_011016 [Juncus effusus]|nr:hypothetical protein LUZ60_011016 [Juncus effusus]
MEERVKLRRDMQQHVVNMISQIDQTAVTRMDSSSSGALNTLTPCAACKLLKRRCSHNCPFFPYFSPLEPEKFAVVHKIFGASNISKLLLEVPESQRVDAANSLVYEAKVRLNNPIYGCMGVICSLQRQVQSLQAELHVLSEIIKHKYKRPKLEDAFATSSSLVVPHADMSVALPSASSSSLHDAPHNSTDHEDYVKISSSENDRYFR